MNLEVNPSELLYMREEREARLFPILTEERLYGKAEVIHASDKHHLYFHNRLWAVHTQPGEAAKIWQKVARSCITIYVSNVDFDLGMQTIYFKLGSEISRAKPWYKDGQEEIYEKIVSVQDLVHLSLTVQNCLIKNGNNHRMSQSRFYLYSKIDDISLSKAHNFYKACVNPACINRKAVLDQNGLYTCQCGHISISCSLLMRLTLVLTDHNGLNSIRAVIYKEEAEKLVGMSTKDFHDLSIVDQISYENTLKRVMGKDIVVRLRKAITRGAPEIEAQEPVFVVDHVFL